MKHNLFLYLSQMRWFWWLRSVMLRISFWIETKFFGVRYGIKEERSNYQSLRHLFSVTQRPLIIALGFAGFVQYVDPYLYPFYQEININIPDDGDYVTFLATISGIGGVFIGLYYAGISAVGSAIYAKVPNNIRDLLAQERFGNVYMGFLSFLTFFGLILIAFRISDLPRVYLAVPIVTISAGVGIIAFVKLGQRAFYLFDPTKLSYHIFEQLQHWLGMVEVGGFQWFNKAFQNHAYRQASKTIDTLETLADIIAKESHLSGKPFIDLSKDLLRFLTYYESVKLKIPSDSAWYEQQYQHRNWYRTEDSHVAIAHQTGTSLQPEVTTNKIWVEDRVLPILKKCLEVNLAAEKFTEVLELFGYVDAYIKCLARQGEVRRAFVFLADVTSLVLDHLAMQSDAEIVKDEVLEKLAVAERVATFPVSIALGYHEHLEAIGLEQVQARLASVRWSSDASIYRQGFPSFCLARLEWFKPRLDFEKETEGKIITPLWYLSELVWQVEAERFVDNVQTFVTMSTEMYEAIISLSLSRKHPWLAAAIMSREWEYWHKIDHQMGNWEEKWSSLSSNRRVEGLSWPDLDVASLQLCSRQRQHKLLKQMSQQSLLLSLFSQPEGFPDYAGQFLHTSGEFAFDALIANDVELLVSVFEPYLMGCFLRFYSLRPRSVSTDWRAQNDLKVAAAALLDVMDISGYARLLADYHGSEQLWGSVATAWNNYLAEHSEQSPEQLLCAAVAITEAGFEIPHRAVLRTTWQQEIRRRLADVPRHEKFYRGAIGADSVIDHESALIRIFAKSPYGSFHDGIDVFIAFYFRELDGAQDLDFGQRRRDLRETLEREERVRPLVQEEDELI